MNRRSAREWMLSLQDKADILEGLRLGYDSTTEPLALAFVALSIDSQVAGAFDEGFPRLSKSQAGDAYTLWKETRHLLACVLAEMSLPEVDRTLQLAWARLERIEPYPARENYMLAFSAPALPYVNERPGLGEAMGL